MENEEKKSVYLIIRYIEGLCIAVFVFGLLWNGTDVLKLSFSQFMILYGGMGAVISEVLARIIYKQVKKK